MTPVSAVQDGTDLSFPHPHHTSSWPVCPKLLAVRVVGRVLGSPPRESAFARLSSAFASSNFTHVPVTRKIDFPVTCLCFGAVPFYKGLQTTRAFSVGVPASMMDTGCCATTDFKAFSLSVDMSLFPMILPCAVSTLHSKPCKCSSWRCNADLRAQGILFGEIDAIAHEPTVTSVIDRVTIHELLLPHCLSPPIIHCESFLQCDCNAESQTRTALTLVLQRCHNLDTALKTQSLGESKCHLPSRTVLM